MSRREIVVNTLLGLLLVSVAALPFLLGIAVLKGADRLITSFWPQLADSRNAALLGFMTLAALTSAVAHSRKRRWRNAFLCFAALPMIPSIWFAYPHSSFGLNGDFWIASFFLILSIPPDSAPTRFRFFATASAISAVIAVNTGLLGSGLIPRIVSDSVLAGLFIWFVIEARRNSNGTTDQSPQTPLFPTNA
jgi:hypothetical protein